MSHYDRRRIMFQLCEHKDKIRAQLETLSSSLNVVPRDTFLPIIAECGIDVYGNAFGDIMKSCTELDNGSVDFEELIDLMSQGIEKIHGRGIMFWSAVMTASGSYLPWTDFQRKLSKWLATNGIPVARVRSILECVHQHLDPGKTGQVRRADFIQFSDRIHGIDSLISDDVDLSFGRTSTSPSEIRAKRVVPTVSPSSSKDVVQSGYNTPNRTPASRVVLKDLRNTLHDSATKKAVTKQAPQQSPRLRQSRDVSDNRNSDMVAVRLRQGLSILNKLSHRRMERLFAAHRASIPVKVVSEINRPIKLVEARLLASLISSSLGKQKNFAFTKLRQWRKAVIGAECSIEDGLSETAPKEAPGLSWKITTQVISVAKLTGSLRSAIGRLRFIGFMVLKTGHRIDHPCCQRGRSWAQSDQGRKDAERAMLEFSNDEGDDEYYTHASNIPTFDLST